ncbi:hypothetical protein [Roseiflexus sp.]|uniref:hypothetical protein n=1 Tax=Roseiflexus sp. TaxID=2562120 RepID=UPI00398B7725
MSHFSLHSIGVILGRYGRYAALEQFIHDLFVAGMVHLVTVPPALFGQITATMTTYRLDFDDTYQYVARRQIDGELVSFYGL